MKGTTTKLTLALDSAVIRKAKKYAKTHQKSISQIVEDYFTLLDADSSASNPAPEALPPKTRHLMGILKGRPVPDFPAEIGSYMQRKYR